MLNDYSTIITLHEHLCGWCASCEHLKYQRKYDPDPATDYMMEVLNVMLPWRLWSSCLQVQVRFYKEQGTFI
jgi:hypothetical protein